MSFQDVMRQGVICPCAWRWRCGGICVLDVEKNTSIGVSWIWGALSRDIWSVICYLLNTCAYICVICCNMF